MDWFCHTCFVKGSSCFVEGSACFFKGRDGVEAGMDSLEVDVLDDDVICDSNGFMLSLRCYLLDSFVILMDFSVTRQALASSFKSRIRPMASNISMSSPIWPICSTKSVRMR